MPYLWKIVITRILFDYTNTQIHQKLPPTPEDPLNADRTSPVRTSAEANALADPPGVGGADRDGGGDFTERGDELGVERGEG